MRAGRYRWAFRAGNGQRPCRAFGVGYHLDEWGRRIERPFAEALRALEERGRQ